MQIQMPYEQAGAGGAVTLTFPEDGDGGTTYAKFVRHLQRLASLDEAEVVELMSSPEGVEKLGRVDFASEVDGWDLAEPSGTAPEANLGPLSAEEYEVFLQGGDPQRLGKSAVIHKANHVHRKRRVFFSWKRNKSTDEAVEMYKQLVVVSVDFTQIEEALKLLVAKLATQDSVLARKLNQIALYHLVFAKRELNKAKDEVGNALEERGVKVGVGQP